jgi:hypothetical protein
VNRIDQQAIERPGVRIHNPHKYTIRPIGPLSIPERPLAIQTVPKARTRIGFDTFYYPDRTTIPETDYLRAKKPFPWPPQLSPVQPVADGTPIMVIYNPGWANYFHRLTQGYFSAWLFKHYAGEGPRRYMHPAIAENALAPLEHLGITKSELFLPPVGETLELQNLQFLSTTYGGYAFQPSPLLPEYAAAIRNSVPPRSGVRRKIYISRRDSQFRRMKNEEVVESHLAAKGYEILQLTGMTFADQVDLFRSADEIVAPHGAGLSNIIFCQKGTKVLELTSHTYFNPCFARIAQVLELDFSLHVSGTTKEAAFQTDIEWDVDIETFLPLT